MLARISHQLPAAAGDAPHPAVPSRLGLLDVPSSTPPHPERPGRASGRKPRCVQRLTGLATKPGEICGLAMRALLAAGIFAAGGVATAGDEINASVGSLPCIPVAAYWTGPPQASGMPEGPGLAVVSTHIRPKDARLHLDDRFIGRARYFDGKPGYLYLEPGNYRLEFRMGGYRTEVFELEAETACRYTLKHRLVREKDTPKERKNDPPGKGKPFDRVFAPQTEAGTTEPGGGPARGGPDPSLRSDLGPDTGKVAAARRATASLHLVVRPASASVYLDGAFVATGLELELMVEPLATTSGAHLIEVRAPGFVSVARNIELEEGEVLELEFNLDAENAQR